MRTPIIAANWKMHMNKDKAIEYIRDFKEMVTATNVEIVLCPPFTLLETVKEETKNTVIKVGAQNVHWEEKGAFTGEISPLMLKELGIDYCIIGHSERRQYFNETNETVNKKLKSVMKHGIRPILCIGESLEDRKKGNTEVFVKEQVVEAFKGIDGEDVKNVVIAYEPIWAIGTGETATPEEANRVIAFIREILREIYGSNISEEIRIQYGGSVKPDNIKSLMDQDDIDGALVGGASLDPVSFAKIVAY